MSGQEATELLPVVDGSDQAVGCAPRDQVHAQGLRHRAVHVLLFDPQGRLYLQQRSPAKDTHPLRWTSSASGHVDPDESYDQAAARELGEELGLSLPLQHLGKLPAGQRTENEFSAVYLAQSGQEPRPNPEEIVQGRWFAWDQALALAQDQEKACPSLAVVLGLLDGPPGPRADDRID